MDKIPHPQPRSSTLCPSISRKLCTAVYSIREAKWLEVTYWGRKERDSSAYENLHTRILTCSSSMLGSANLCKGCNADSSSFRRIFAESQAERAVGFDSDEVDEILSSQIVFLFAFEVV